MNKEAANIFFSEPLTLTMNRPGVRKERLGIRNEYPQGELAKTIFQSVGLMYLVSPYFPEKINTDFYVPLVFQELIGGMYKKENYEGPKFLLTEHNLAKQKEPHAKNLSINNDRAVLTYSGGKDSMWNMDWLSRKFGMKNVLAVHFNQMNHVAATQEFKSTIKQSEKIGFPLAIVDLLNSSKNRGKSIMRARDMFIVGVSIPLAIMFDSSRVVLEGGFYPKGSKKGEPFTTYEDSWDLFNNLFKSIGIPVKAEWRTSNGMDTVRDLLNNQPDWLPLVYNCFTPECYKPGMIAKWKREAPSFPLYKGQCGSCVKCRELNIARIAYDPAVQKAKPDDVRKYISDTIRWTDGHKRDLADILDGAFTDHLKMVATRYGI